MLNTLLSPFIRFFELIRSFIIYKVRIDGVLLDNFYQVLKKNGKMYEISYEYTKGQLPRQLDAYAYYKKIFLIFNITERLLRAGFTSVDKISTIYIFRFQKKRLFKLFDKCLIDARQDIPIFILKSWASERIGNLSDVDNLNSPYIDIDTYNIMDNEIKRVLNKEKSQTGFLLYGQPGNGKSCLMKYFAIKYKIPVYIVTFNSDTTNEQIITMFSRIQSPGIILFEDFDSYFNLRKNKLANAKFTLDAILNVIDGSYTVNKGLIFIMTTNNLKAIDPALKFRPSRFRYLLNIKNPNKVVRERIFQECKENINIESNKYSLDELLFIKEKLMLGEKFKDILKHLNLCYKSKKVKKVAYNIKPKVLTPH